MSPQAQTRRKPRSPPEPIENGTIDLTKESCRTTESENNDISSSLPKPCGDGSKMPGDGVSLARGVYHKYANNEHFLKTIKPANCLKYMNIEAHPHLLKEWYMEALPAQASALGVTIVEAPALCCRTVAMSRTLPRELVADQEQVLQLSELRKSSMRFLYILPACDVTERLNARDFSSHMAARKRTLGGQITVVILDAVRYFKKGKPLNEAIEDMLITLEIDTLIVHSAEELATLILQYTKAVAEEPAKLAKRSVDDQAEFYMRGDNKNCVTVDQNGNGRDRLWQQMLSVLPQSSLEVSRAIAAHHASPRLLAQALSKEGGASELASLGVSRSAAPDARARRLGPEMATKLHRLFTIKDGNFVVE